MREGIATQLPQLRFVSVVMQLVWVVGLAAVRPDFSTGRFGGLSRPGLEQVAVNQAHCLMNGISIPSLNRPQW